MKQGNVFASSLDVAVYFGKDHRHVLDAVRAEMKDLGPIAENSALGFISSTYRREIGCGAVKEYPCYLMTKTACLTVVLGFTGRKAAHLRRALVERFEAMEAELRRIELEKARGDREVPATAEPRIAADRLILRPGGV